MERPNGTPRQTRLEWENIKRELDAEKAVVLTLIHKSARSTKDLFNVIWDNHQVLAYGYTPRTDGMLDIHIYDSNFPGVNDAIVQAKRVPLNTDQGPGSFRRIENPDECDCRLTGEPGQP